MDVETTTKNKGNPYTEGNILCYVGLRENGVSSIYSIHSRNFRGWVDHLSEILRSGPCTLVVFNGKFDIAWIEKEGVDCKNVRIWDVQYAEFLFENQRNPFPALEQASIKYGFGEKMDIVKRDFWDKDIDTLDIPPEIMVQYLDRDLELTENVFLKQKELFNSEQKSKYRLFLLHMEDQHCLRAMEQNGVLFNSEESLSRAKDIETEIQELDKELLVGYEGVPINFGSNDHLSRYLYGGIIVDSVRIPVGEYKTGAKIGQTRYKIVKYEYNLPRIFEPLPKTELAKEGYYATDEKTLRQLRGTKEAKKKLSCLDRRSKLEKLRGTYYEGYPKKIAEMGWANDIMHPSLNQCRVVTGRLSSNNPNGQNMSPEVKQLCVSRYV